MTSTQPSKRRDDSNYDDPQQGRDRKRKVLTAITANQGKAPIRLEAPEAPASKTRSIRTEHTPLLADKHSAKQKKTLAELDVTSLVVRQKDSTKSPDSGYYSLSLTKPPEIESDGFDEEFDDEFESAWEEMKKEEEEATRREEEQARLEEQRRRDPRYINHVYNWVTGSYDLEDWDPDWSEEE